MEPFMDAHGALINPPKQPGANILRADTPTITRSQRGKPILGHHVGGAMVHYSPCGPGFVQRISCSAL